MTFLLEPFAEVIIEFLLREGIQRWRQMRQRSAEPDKYPFPRSHRAFVPRTSLVNRERELRAIHSALTGGSELRILYFSGGGGVGKTRLLQEVAGLVKKTKTNAPLRWGGVIDLYHADFHSFSGLQQAIIEELDPKTQHFKEYRATRERIEQRRQEGLFGQALDKEQTYLNETFITDYNTFAQRYRPVIALDTLEVLSHESDLIQELCGLENMPIAAREWMLQHIGEMKNTVFIMAGRPQASFPQSLQRVYGNTPARLEMLQLDGMILEDSRQLVKLLLKNAPASVTGLRQKADQLHYMTQGQPVKLALAVELAGQMAQVATTLDTEETLDSNTWSRYVTRTLFHYDDPDDRTFFFLALARKGLTAELLHYLYPVLSIEECAQHLKELHKLSIIKVRPNSEAVFLHDVLYELFDEYPPDDEHTQPWYELLTDYYREEQAQAGNDREEWGQATVNLLYYELQRDPRQAFEDGYIRWSEAAIKGHEVALDMRLRDELLRFFQSPVNQRLATCHGLTREIIDRDSAVRWVKRYIMQSQNKQAVELAETILSFNPDLWSRLSLTGHTNRLTLSPDQQAAAQKLFQQADNLFWGHILTYYGEALTYVGDSEGEALVTLEHAIQLLNNITPHDQPEAWIRDNILGHAHNKLGYLLRIYGHYGNALNCYKSALYCFEQANIFNEQAYALNDLSLLLALLGDVSQAKTHVNQALHIRRQLGQRYPTALSYNTRGRIYALQSKGDPGLRDCTWALGIFEQVEEPRGIGLACNALGFIYRQQGKRWSLEQHTGDRVLRPFQQATTFLERAMSIFQDEVAEPLRLWEAYNEMGSLCHDWGYWLHQQGDEQAAQRQYVTGVEYQEQALKIAQSSEGLHLQAADTCDDLAQLWFRQNDLTMAQRWMDQTLALIPPEYTVTRGQGFQSAPESGEAYWLVLGKAHWQQATWAAQSSIHEHDSTQQPGHAQKLIEHFCLAIACFERYWPQTDSLHKRFLFATDYLKQAGIVPSLAQSLISQVAADYHIDVSVWLNSMPPSAD